MSDIAQQLYFRSYGPDKVLVGEGWPKNPEPDDPETYDAGTDDAHVARWCRSSSAAFRRSRRR